jgi:AcrR family transcriptional regulator
MLAAVELIGEKGFENTTTAEISERAGYSKAMVHVRYGSKEALLESLQRSYEPVFMARASAGFNGLDEILAQIETLRAQARDNAPYLRAFLMLCFETVGLIPGLRPWIRDWFHRFVEQIEQMVRRGQADGSIRETVNPALEAQHFLDVGTGITFTWLVRPDASDFNEAAATWEARLRSWLQPAGAEGEADGRGVA